MQTNQRDLVSLFICVSFLTCTLGDDHLLSCLTFNGVHNYTTLSGSNPDYHRLLYIRLQNPLFTKSTIPKPTAIILPESKEQLASSIICCRRGSWTIRIRSGGHSYEGLSHIADSPFVIIDLMNLNRVSIDLESQTAWVESGATLGEIYHAIAESSNLFGFSAGWCPTVGSGGHISGGGFGLMSRKYGLAADNVVDALLIDANGVVFDRKSMGEDVFWAIRGGGGGVWGAIYAWKIQLLPVPENVTALKVRKHTTKSEASKLLHKWQLVAPELEDDFTIVVVAQASANNSFWLMFFGLYLGPKVEAVSSINRSFPELEIDSEECMELSWAESFVYIQELETVSDLNNRFLTFHGDDKAFKTKVDYAKVPIPLEVIDVALEMLAKEQRGLIALVGQGGMMGRISSDAIPFPHRNGTLLMIEYGVVWNEDEDQKSDEFIGWLQRLYDYMGPFVSNDPRVGYVNFVDLDLGRIDWTNTSISSSAIEIARTWGEKYFLSNYDRLVRAKTLIDPNNVFHHPQSIPPLPGMDLRQISGLEVERSAFV